jgi:hypothetical protein
MRALYRAHLERQLFAEMLDERSKVTDALSPHVPSVPSLPLRVKEILEQIGDWRSETFDWFGSQLS